MLLLETLKYLSSCAASPLTDWRLLKGDGHFPFGRMLHYLNTSHLIVYALGFLLNMASSNTLKVDAKAAGNPKWYISRLASDFYMDSMPGLDDSIMEQLVMHSGHIYLRPRDGMFFWLIEAHHKEPRRNLVSLTFLLTLAYLVKWR